MARFNPVLRRLLRGVLAAGGLILLSRLIVFAVVAALGGPPPKAWQAVVIGSVGSPDALTESLIKATPLAFTGLSVAIAFRAGIWNIGAEGQLLMGMLGGAAAALWLGPGAGPWAIPLSLLAGAGLGALWAGLAALLRLRRQVPEVISTIMLNFLAVYLIEYLVRGPLRDRASSNDWSPLLSESTHLPRLTSFGIGRLGGDRLALGGEGTLTLGLEAGRLHLGVLLAMVIAVMAAVWVAATPSGFRTTVVGHNPVAAATAGMRVSRTLTVAFLVSGALAGLGGAVEVLGLMQRLYRFEPGSPGYGFSGIPVALLAGLSPLGVLGSAFFFGALAAGCAQMQRTAGVTFQVAYVIQALVVLLLVGMPSAKELLQKWWPRRP